MYARAISIGYAVPCTDFDASVHSAFASAVNLKADGQDLLLTLLPADGDDLPQGIRFDRRDGLLRGEWPAGKRVVCRGGVLSTEGCSFVLDLRKASLWLSRLSEIHLDTHNSTAIAAWQCAWRAVNDWQLRSQSGILAQELTKENVEGQPAWIRQMGSSVRALLKATEECKLEVANVLGSLIGLGPGLTPSGDDLIAGYLGGLWCAAGDDDKRAGFVSGLGELVIRLSKGTTDISRTYLLHAAHAQISGRLTRLAQSICAGESPQLVLGNAQAAMQVGHTSGADAVTGLLLGLAAWDRHRLLDRDANARPPASIAAESRRRHSVMPQGAVTTPI